MSSAWDEFVGSLRDLVAELRDVDPDTPEARLRDSLAAALADYDERAGRDGA